MASYMRIDNQAIEELYKSDLNGAEIKVMLLIIRYTLGFHRNHAGLSSSYIANGIGLNERTVKRAINVLKNKNFIEISTEGTRRKDIKLGVKLSKGSGQQTPRTSGQQTPRTSGQQTPEEIIEENIEENIEEETEFSSEIAPPDFENMTDEEWDKYWYGDEEE